MGRSGTKANGAYPLVSMEWQDAHAIGEWVEAHELDGALATCVTVGFLIKESRESVTLAATISQGMFNDIQVIPRRSITKRTVLNRKGSPPSR